MIKNVYILKPFKDAKFKALAVWLRAHGVSANMVSLAGLILGLVAAFCFLARLSFPGMFCLCLSVGADLLDGTVARLGKVATISGKIVDSVYDRLVEAAWVGALIFSGVLNIWALALVSGSVLLLVCRIWAYQLGLESSFVIVTRFERVIAISGVIILPWRNAALVIYTVVTIGTFISSLQIIKMILKMKVNHSL